MEIENSKFQNEPQNFEELTVETMAKCRKEFLKQNTFGYCILHYAAASGNLSLCQHLIKFQEKNQKEKNPRGKMLFLHFTRHSKICQNIKFPL